MMAHSERTSTASSNQEKRKNSLVEETEQSPSLGVESSLIVRLHFAEAMMVVICNALGQPQQASIKQHFDDLLKRLEKVDVIGVQSETFQLYRDALGAMQRMLASNPRPEAMATALAHHLAKRYSSANDRAPNSPRSAG
jgi:hypothetical protein